MMLETRLHKGTESYLWEVALAVADEQASLSATTISYHDYLLGIGGSLCDIGGCRFPACGLFAVHCADSALTRSLALLSACWLSLI
jgi:hypothetical protein